MTREEAMTRPADSGNTNNVNLTNKLFEQTPKNIEKIEQYLKANCPEIFRNYYVGQGRLRRGNIIIEFDGEAWILRNDQGVEFKTDNKLELIQTVSNKFGISLRDAVAIEQLCIWLREAYESQGDVIEKEDVVEEGDGHGLFRIQPLTSVIENAKPTEWIIPKLLPRRGLVFLAGKAGVGKSFLALALSHAISSNHEKALECLDVESHGKVLIIDGENYPSTYKDRVEAMKLNPIDNIDITILENFYLDKPEYLAELEKQIEANDYKLIILDPWTCFIGDIDENKASDVSKILNELRRIAYENDVCFLIIHHLRKNLAYVSEPLDELRGSSSLVNEADLVAILTADKFGRILRVVKSRLEQPIALKIDFEESDGKLEIKAREIAIEECLDEVAKATDEIIAFLRAKGGVAKRKEFEEGLPRSKATIGRALDILLRTGRIVRIKKGYYKLNPTLDSEAA